MNHYDVAVIGAGPGGLAAASTAAKHGASVVLLDEATRSGGQYFRHMSDDDGRRHAQWRTFRRLDRMVDVDFHPNSRVWMIESGRSFTIHCVMGVRETRPMAITATNIILATGAIERQLPFDGWTLPGVMSVGGVQALLKGSGVTVESPIVVAGTGPFLLPVTTGIAKAGATVAGIFEANRPQASLLAAVSRSTLAVETGGYLASLTRHRIPYRTGMAVTAAHGDGRLEQVTVTKIDRDWRVIPGSERDIPCRTLAVGFGFVPRLDLAVSLGAQTVAAVDGTVVLAVSATQRTSVPGLYAVGELTGIGGAPLAMVEGSLAGHAVTASRPAARLLTRRSALRGFADRLLAAFPVGEGWPDWLSGSTVVCRCEEVSSASIARALARGATDVRTVKLLSRAGMGWCQGRVCETAVARLCGQGLSAVSQRRVIATPISVGDLAKDDSDGEER